jgi:hypothetical protein
MPHHIHKCLTKVTNTVINSVLEIKNKSWQAKLVLEHTSPMKVKGGFGFG